MIKLKPIKFSKILKSLELNSQMKGYFNNDNFDFDEHGFNEFWKNSLTKNKAQVLQNLMHKDSHLIYDLLFLHKFFLC